MSSLLIGGAGLVGSHVAKLTPSVVIDDLSRGDRRNVICDFIKGDVQELALIDALIARSDNVYFFAAIPVLDCDNNPEWARAVMVDGLKNVISACGKYGKKLIYSSSGSVYGETPRAYEDDPLLGDTLYAKLKIEAEELLEVSHIQYVGLRYQSIYGNAIQKGYKAVIQKYRETKGKLPVYGDGSQAYDFINVEDVARANILASRKGHGFYNIGTGIKTSILELAEMMGEPEFVEGYTPIKEMCCDPTKAEKELGFKAQVSLRDWLSAA